MRKGRERKNNIKMFATAAIIGKRSSKSVCAKSYPGQETRDKSAVDANGASSRQNAHNWRQKCNTEGRICAQPSTFRKVQFSNSVIPLLHICIVFHILISFLSLSRQGSGKKNHRHLYVGEGSSGFLTRSLGLAPGRELKSGGSIFRPCCSYTNKSGNRPTMVLTQCLFNPGRSVFSNQGL
jgi:hypothetical protein